MGGMFWLGGVYPVGGMGGVCPADGLQAGGEGGGGRVQGDFQGLQ